MGVVGRADDHPVDFLAHLVQHDAEIFELFGSGVLRELLGGVLIIHVAKRDQVVARSGHFIDIRAAAAADADASHVDFFIGRNALGPAQQTARNDLEQGSAGASTIEKLSSTDRGGSWIAHRICFYCRYPARLRCLREALFSTRMADHATGPAFASCHHPKFEIGVLIRPSDF